MKNKKSIPFYVITNNEEEQKKAEIIFFENEITWKYAGSKDIIILKGNNLYFDGENIWHATSFSSRHDYIMSFSNFRNLMPYKGQIEFDFYEKE
jgi:alpha-acetolactate decarboxylase